MPWTIISSKRHYRINTGLSFRVGADHNLVMTLPWGWKYPRADGCGCARGLQQKAGSKKFLVFVGSQTFWSYGLPPSQKACLFLFFELCLFSQSSNGAPSRWGKNARLCSITNSQLLVATPCCWPQDESALSMHISSSGPGNDSNYRLLLGVSLHKWVFHPVWPHINAALDVEPKIKAPWDVVVTPQRTELVMPKSIGQQVTRS